MRTPALDDAPLRPAGARRVRDNRYPRESIEWSDAITLPGTEVTVVGYDHATELPAWLQAALEQER